MKTRILITGALLFLALTTGFSQENFKVREIKNDKNIQVSNKSRTLKMKKGDSQKIALDLKKDRAYYISVCGHKSLSDIQFKIVSADKVSDVLYDNSAYEFTNGTMVSVKEDARVFLEIKTQPKGYFGYSTAKKDVELFIASKKARTSTAQEMNNMVVLVSKL
jgi:hypothetical protein